MWNTIELETRQYFQEFLSPYLSYIRLSNKNEKKNFETFANKCQLVLELCIQLSKVKTKLDTTILKILLFTTYFWPFS